MPKKTFTPEQIVGKLRQIEVLVSQGKTVPVACREAGIVEQTFYRWRKEYGGLQLEQAKRLKELQNENAQLGTQRYQPTQRNDEDQLSQAIITLASECGRFGYRRVTALLQQAGSLAIDVGKFVVSSESYETFMAPLTASNQRP